MATDVITLWRIYIILLTRSVSTMHSVIEIMFTLKAIESHYKGSYEKWNLTHVVVSYEIYEITTCVRFSVSLLKLVLLWMALDEKLFLFTCILHISIDFCPSLGSSF